MEPYVTEAIVNLGVELTKLAVKGTTTAVNKKITAIKDEKKVETVRSTYDEIINELLQERDEAVRIAQSYKSELERVQISDDDLKCLHNTVSRLLEMFNVNLQNEQYGQMKELISIDTLKTMQLLGFNYKIAIGEPFTQLCADKISSLGAGKKQNSNSSNAKGNRRN
jgi:hypothetical protein